MSPTQIRRRRAIVVLLVTLVVVGGCSASPVRPTVSLPSTTIASDVTIGPTEVTLPDDVDEPVVVPPGADLGALVEAAPEGSTFVLEPGVHRGHRIEPKTGMSFLGEEGAVLRGAVLLDGFDSDADAWIAVGPEPTARDHGECIDGYTACRRTQDLFMDGVMLWQVDSIDELEPGSWFWSEEGIRVADDPTHRRVELSTVAYAFVGAADDVTIRDLTVEMYATPAQEGAIQGQMPGEGERGTGWLIERVEVTGAHGAGIRAGDATVIRDSFIHHNGQLGVTGAGGTGLVIEDSEIAHNNIAGFRWEWEAGGVKVTNSFDVTMRGNHVHSNIGPGLWADLDTLDTTYRANRVVGNTGPGIFHEISGAALIADNEVTGNGSDKTSWLWGAGILVAGSWDTVVSGNVVEGNANAIAGIQQDRGEGPFGARLLSDLWVHDNTITVGSGAVGIVEDVGDDAVFESRNNRFTSNTYVDAVGRVYRWDDRALPRRGWIEAGQDVDGVWLDDE